jgi:hypothetical protein
LNDRLFLTGAVRADDNSAFGRNFSAAYYPKASLAWVLSGEPFWNVEPINTLKLRAAYGHSGKQPDVNSALRTFLPVTGGGGSAAVTPGAIGNPDLKPERGTELELGFDAGLFGDRVGVEFTYYNKRTKDAIVAVQLPPSGGFPGSRFVNIGELSNKGIELLVNARVVETRNLAFDLFQQRVISATLNPTTLRAENILCDGGTGPRNLSPGGNGVPCASAPAVFLGRAFPGNFGSISPRLTLFNRVELYALVDFQRDFYRPNSEASQACSSGTCAERFFPEQFDITRVANQQMSFSTAYALEDASFAKLREVSVKYTLPDRWARSLKASRATLNLAGQNLHTWTGFGGLDPEPTRLSSPFIAGGGNIVPPNASLLVRGWICPSSPALEEAVRAGAGLSSMVERHGVPPEGI